MTDVLELLRAINVPLLMASTVALGIRVNDLWGNLSRGRRMTYGAAVLLFANGAVGSAIKYVTHAPVDISTAFTTVICLILLLGMWLSRHEIRHTPPTR